MLNGTVIGLRELRRGDLDVMHAALDNDAELASLSDNDPYVPRTLERRVAEFEKRQTEPPRTDNPWFAVQRLDDPDGACLGSIGLWGVNDHQRIAHIGMTLLPAARGLGHGKDALATVCRYGFEIRNLERLQLETLDVNEAMKATALACGFVQEGRLRSNAWHLGRRVDELLFGLLADEWRAGRTG